MLNKKRGRGKWDRKIATFLFNFLEQCKLEIEISLRASHTWIGANSRHGVQVSWALHTTQQPFHLSIFSSLSHAHHHYSPKVTYITCYSLTSLVINWNKKWDCQHILKFLPFLPENCPHTHFSFSSFLYMTMSIHPILEQSLQLGFLLFL